MPKRKYVKVAEFAELNEIDIGNLQVMKSMGYMPDGVFKGKGKGSLVDANFFDRRAQFKRKAWLRSHDNYYELMEKYTEAELSEMLAGVPNAKRTKGSWQNYMCSVLFQLPIERITLTKTPEMLYEFYRLTNHIIRREARAEREEATDKEVRESRYVPEFRVLGFDCVDDMYDSYEAERIYDDIRRVA